MLAMLACMTFLFNDWMLLLAAIFTAVGYGLMSSVTQRRRGNRRRERSGIANSTYYAGIDLGMSVGPFVGGLVYGICLLCGFIRCLCWRCLLLG